MANYPIYIKTTQGAIECTTAAGHETSVYVGCVHVCPESKEK